VVRSALLSMVIFSSVITVTLAATVTLVTMVTELIHASRRTDGRTDSFYQPYIYIYIYIYVCVCVCVCVCVFFSRSPYKECINLRN
jgi:uncharacterized membrane protein YdbT with pleckstrin-like domain